jgi:hypothetical protein
MTSRFRTDAMFVTFNIRKKYFLQNVYACLWYISTPNITCLYAIVHLLLLSEGKLNTNFAWPLCRYFCLVKKDHLWATSLYTSGYLLLDETIIVNIKLRGKHVEGFKKSKRNVGEYLEFGSIIEPWNSPIWYKIADCTIAKSSVTVCIWWNWEKTD